MAIFLATDTVGQTKERHTVDPLLWNPPAPGTTLPTPYCPGLI